MTVAVVETTPHRVIKSEAAFRTISEVAEDLDVPQHVLRFWESRFPQIKPLKRGGGRRYYRPADVHLLRRIRDLLYKDGYTIKGVQKLLRDGTLKIAEAPPSPPDLLVAPDLLEATNGAEAAFHLDHEEPDEAVAAPAVPPVAAAAPPISAPTPAAPASKPDSAPAPVGLNAVQQGELRSILGDLKALREILHQTLT